MNRALSSAALLLAVLPRPAPARAQAPDRILTWDDCVGLAENRNPALFSSMHAEEASRAAYRGSFNGLLPGLSLTNSYNTANDFGATNGFHWQADGTASLRVLDAGQIAGIRSASAVLSQAEAVHRLASSTLRLALQQDFAQLLFDQADLNVLKTIADLRRKDAQMIALRYNSGRESKGDMLRSKAQLLQAEADYAQELRNLRTSRKALDRDLGLDDFTVVSATGSLAAKLPPPLPDNLTPYLDARPDVALQEAVVRGAEAGVEQSWSTAWPALSLTYSRSALGQKEFPSRQYGWSFLGVLSYPLFGGGPTSTYYAVSAAKRSLEKAREDLRGVRNQAVVGLESSWSSLMGAIDQVAVQTALLAAARQRNAEADIEYQGGLIDFNAWEIIASDRISQEKLAIQATLNAALAQAAWDNALGKELRD